MAAAVKYITFSENCEKAAGSFLMFEKAFPADRKATIKHIKSLSVPVGLEVQWRFVVSLCEDFEKYRRIDITRYPIAETFGITIDNKVISSSDQFSALLRQISQFVDNHKSSIPSDFFNNREAYNQFADICQKAKEYITCYDNSSAEAKAKIKRKLLELQPPSGYIEQWEFASSLCKCYFDNGNVNISDFTIPSSVSIVAPPFPIRGAIGLVDMIVQIGQSRIAEMESGSPSLKLHQSETSAHSEPGKVWMDIQTAKCNPIEWEQMLSKEQIMDCYRQYIETLLCSQEKIKSLKARNHKFAEIQNQCLDKIKVILETSHNQMNQVMNETVWDKLVIAFFGETNAGKSTIIETFRVKYRDPIREDEIKKNHGKAVDGLIVGDGRSDFTQVYEKYNLNIDNKPFILIDVPGIEGKEVNYLKEIASALKQAHCVFYVQGHNTKPNAATAEKIKGFLSDWVSVYSIYNVRGGASNYDEEEEREVLMTQDKLDRENSIIEVFEDILPGIYKGNVSCQGLLALLSVANFHDSRLDLIGNQDKIIKYFGDRESVLKFSKFSDIEDLVRQQSDNFSQNIIIANRNKLQGLSKKIANGLGEIIDEQTKKLDAFYEQLTTYKSAISGFRNDILSIMRSQMHSEVTEALSELRRATNDIIDDGNNAEEWAQRLEYRIGTIRETLEDSIHEIYKNGISDFHARIESKKKDLDKMKYLKFDIPDVDIDITIDLSSILEELKLGFKEAIGGFFQGFLNPIGTIIKLFKNSDDGRDIAKRKAAQEIDNAKSSIMYEVNSKLDEIKRSIQQEEKLFSNTIESEKTNIKDLKLELSKLYNDFRI